MGDIHHTVLDTSLPVCGYPRAEAQPGNHCKRHQGVCPGMGGRHMNTQLSLVLRVSLFRLKLQGLHTKTLEYFISGKSSWVYFSCSLAALSSPHRPCPLPLTWCSTWAVSAPRESVTCWDLSSGFTLILCELSSASMGREVLIYPRFQWELSIFVVWIDWAHAGAEKGWQWWAGKSSATVNICAKEEGGSNVQLPLVSWVGCI